MAAFSSPRTRVARLLAVSGLLVGTFGLVTIEAATPVTASDSPLAQRGPGHVTSDPLPTVQINGVVWDQTIVGNRVYAVGEFTQARPAGAPVGQNEILRSNILAYDITTGELDQPRVPCVGSDDCLALRGNGVRNTTWRLSHLVSAGLGLTPWLDVGASFGVHTHLLHGSSEVEGVSHQAIDDTDTRHYFSYGLNLGIKPFDALGVGLGASTFNPQRAPNNELHDPFLNRHTQVFVDLSLDVAALTSGDDS